MAKDGVRFRVKATDKFFDRKAVIDAIGPAKANALRKAGVAVMYKARSSMRKMGAKRLARGDQWKAASKPGRPPRNWEGLRPRGGLLVSRLFATYDTGTQSTVVGPEGMGSAAAPSILEYGGTVSIPNRRRTVRKLGGGGEIRIGGKATRTTKPNTEGVSVTYANLRTPGMVATANKLNEELYGPTILTSKMVAPRPYMAPALEKTKAKLPEFFRDTIRT